VSDVLDRAIAEHDPSHVFAMFSGGHDSLAATALTMRHPRASAVVHVNTGIGIEQTREFVRETCRAQGWPLREYLTPARVYEEAVLRNGFPGPAQHQVMYRNLKERRIRDLVRDHKQHRNDRIMLVTGARSDESVRRMGVVEPVRRDGAVVWVAPIFDWSKSDCNDLIEREGLARNLVVDLLHMSGECLCGAFAKPDEIAQLETWFPTEAARLHKIERRAEAAGRIACVWGRRPDDVNPEQQRLMPILPLCTSCEASA
jgi:3'-phosphoadenosine 5'-phosphosulfate sulfotransferase (PAPS reductase)/FAD synthetase